MYTLVDYILKGLGPGPLKGPLGALNGLGLGPLRAPLCPKGPQAYGVPFSKFDPLSYFKAAIERQMARYIICLLYTSPSPRD